MKKNSMGQIITIFAFIYSVLFFYPLSLLAANLDQLTFLDMDPAFKSRLRSVALLIVEGKSEDDVLKAWDKCVDKTRRVDYNACIAFIFQEVKREAEAKARFATMQIDHAEKMKKVIVQEQNLIRNLKSQWGKGISPNRFTKKTFVKTRTPPGIIFKESESPAVKEEFDRYEVHLQWAEKEINLQGTGGVALLEYAKDHIQTAASNISGTGTMSCKMRKIVERKMQG